MSKRKCLLLCLDIVSFSDPDLGLETYPDPVHPGSEALIRCIYYAVAIAKRTRKNTPQKSVSGGKITFATMPDGLCIDIWISLTIISLPR